jgi:hypothetical protein
LERWVESIPIRRTMFPTAASRRDGKERWCFWILEKEEGLDGDVEIVHL